MFGFDRKISIGFLRIHTIGNLSESLLSNSEESIKCVSLNNQPCQARPTLVNVNSNKSLYYPITASVNKYGRRCNTIDDPYA